MRKISILLFATFLLFACKSNDTTETVAIVSGQHTDWVYDATIYEVNVRQYTTEGTFSAFEEHIPRLQELGVDILWFMPIQAIGEVERKGTLGSYYSIYNYTEVNSEFGTLQDFKSVVDKAHASGMKVILDWVANHTSRDAVWLENEDWYVTDSDGNVVAPYDWSDVAKLNYDNKDMRDAMLQSMLWWVREAGIDGFRCDVANEVPTDFWLRATDSLKAIKPDIFMLAEAEEPELNVKAFDAYYAWDFHHKMNMVAKGEGNVDSLRISLNKMNSRFDDRAIPMYFTSNHDENSWNGTEFERMGDAVSIFAALTYVLPGMPLIYNGQEVGFNRRLEFFEKDNIDWSDSGSKFQFTDLYVQLNAFKKSNSALFTQEKGGEMVEVENNISDKVWSFKRLKGENEVHCVFNFTDEDVVVSFEKTIAGEGFKDFHNATSSDAIESVKLKAWEYKLFYKN
ncbi:MAG TPA: alpha-amylase family glycosyl hydrolase [Dysgonamonadaceae bacterium]|nr:alpha-amylase family glycosyl hydrolase [Dysgonamonadaceae bacterium]